MDTNYTQWEIRCPNCGARFYYKAPQVTIKKEYIGISQRKSEVVVCPECNTFFTDMILHSWVDSKKNYGVIIEDE